MLVNQSDSDDVEGLGLEYTALTLAVALVMAAILAITGIALLLFYKPTDVSGRPLQPDSDVVVIDWIRFAHRWSATLMIVAFVLLLAMTIVRTIRGTRRVGAVAAPALATVVVAIAIYTGKLLPY